MMSIVNWEKDMYYVDERQKGNESMGFLNRDTVITAPAYRYPASSVIFALTNANYGGLISSSVSIVCLFGTINLGNK